MHKLHTAKPVDMFISMKLWEVIRCDGSIRERKKTEKSHSILYGYCINWFKNYILYFLTNAIFLLEIDWDNGDGKIEWRVRQIRFSSLFVGGSITEMFYLKNLRLIELESVEIGKRLTSWNAGRHYQLRSWWIEWIFLGFDCGKIVQTVWRTKILLFRMFYAKNGSQFNWFESKS